MTPKNNEEINELIENIKKAEKVVKEKKEKKNNSENHNSEKLENESKKLDDILKKFNNNDETVDTHKVKEIKNDDKKISSKAKKVIAGLTTGVIILGILVGASKCAKRKNEIDDIKPINNQDSSSYSVVIDSEENIDNKQKFDPTNDEDVSKKASVIYNYVNTANMKYDIALIEDAVRILNQVEPKNKNITIDNVIDFLDNWANKCIINQSNYIAGVEEYKNDAAEIHYAEFFDEGSIDYEAIKDYDDNVNKATHTDNLDEVYDAANEMLKNFYETIELDGKETEYGLANRNSLSKGGIAVLETEIVDTLPILEEVDSKNKLNYSNENAVVDQNGNEGENHGYNNDPVNGINIIKLRLNPLSKEEYDLYFKSIFEDVYGINYSEVKKIAAKSLTTHKNTTTEIPDVSFYKSLKNAIGNMPDVEYENQMLDMEALTRLFYSYYTGEIQPAEESDLNQDWNELEQIRIENCSKVKSR